MRAVILFCVLLLALLPSVRSDTFSNTQECSQLKDITGINTDNLVEDNENPDEPSYGFKADGTYFCGADAPTYLQCKCGISNVCSEKRDPWGLDMGECGCCTTWVIILFAVFIFVIVVVLIGGLYACVCHGTWMYDGFPQAITPLLPQRSATIIAPASFPLPEQAFRPYRSSDFISSDDPQAISAAIAATSAAQQQQSQQQQQQQPAQDGAGSEEGVRRRRARGAREANDPLAVPMTPIQGNNTAVAAARQAQPNPIREHPSTSTMRAIAGAEAPNGTSRPGSPNNATRPPATAAAASSSATQNGERLAQADSFGDLEEDGAQANVQPRPQPVAPTYSPANREIETSANRTQPAANPPPATAADDEHAEFDPSL